MAALHRVAHQSYVVAVADALPLAIRAGRAFEHRVLGLGLGLGVGLRLGLGLGLGLGVAAHLQASCGTCLERTKRTMTHLVPDVMWWPAWRTPLACIAACPLSIRSTSPLACLGLGLGLRLRLANPHPHPNPHPYPSQVAIVLSKTLLLFTTEAVPEQSIEP